MDIKNLPQPLGFFHVITNADALHYGYWPDDQHTLTLQQAQHEHSLLLLKRFPPPPARILDVGCGLGLMAEELHKAGYQVTAIAPSEDLIRYAQYHHAGPDFINCGFLDERAELLNEAYDVLLFQESLQYFPDLAAVFHKAGKLLAENGRIVLCDEVSYHEQTKERSAVHTTRTIESAFFQQGFFIQHHKKMGHNVTPTCRHVLAGFEQQKQQMLSEFGEHVAEQITHQVTEWNNLLHWYQSETFGYELWELRFSPYVVRGYQSNDAAVILEQFNPVFNQQRSLSHWNWKYLNNPQGGPCVSTAWEGKQLASHYSAYPLALTVNNHEEQTYHVGDTFTVPAWRGIGRGKTSLLSRVVRHFHKNWCEHQIDFFYGFNTGRIQKLGKQFLSYVSVAPVYEYALEQADISTTFNHYSKLKRLLQGYQIELTEQIGDWAEQVFTQTKAHYGMCISRHKTYLQWRYEQHPEFHYQYILLKKWGKVVAWCVIRKSEQQLLLIDSLCLPQHSHAFVLCLQEVLVKTPDTTRMSGWFSKTPSWWHEQLLDNDFVEKRQFQQLDLCATFFSARFSPQDLSDNFYFTMGDSDLY